MAKFGSRQLRFQLGRAATRLFPALQARMPFFDKVVPIVEAGETRLLCEDEPLLVTPEEARFTALLPESQRVTGLAERATALVELSDVTLTGNTGVVIDEAKRELYLARGENRGATYWDFRTEFTHLVDQPAASYFNMMGPHSGHAHIWHFYFDRALKLYHALETFGLKDRPLVVLANEDLAGHQKDFYRFVSMRYPLVSLRQIPRGERWRVPKLLHVDDWQNMDRSYANERAVQFLREIFFSGYGVAPGGKRRLYLTRNDTRKRRLLNEDAMLSMLAARGFDVVAPGEFSFADQVKMFASAEAVVGPHGAAFTNLLFAPAGARVIEITPQQKMLRCFYLLAKRLHQTHRGYLGSRGDKNESFTFEPERLEAALDELKL